MVCYRLNLSCDAPLRCLAVASPPAPYSPQLYYKYSYSVSGSPPINKDAKTTWQNLIWGGFLLNLLLIEVIIT